MKPDHGNPLEELQAALHRCVLFDRSGLGRLVARGADILDLLHRLSTADLKGLKSGEGRPTVLTTGKGRIVSRLFVQHLGEDGVFLGCGEGEAQAVNEHLTRFTFAEKTELSDQTGSTFQFALSGPRAGAVYEDRAGLIAEPSVHWLAQDGLSTAGYSVVGPKGSAEPIWEALVAAVGRHGGLPAGSRTAEAWRILRGIPAAGHELTLDHNPLEAGLLEAVSFDKGCYVGQEVVARLQNYDKIARGIRGVRFEPEAAVPLPGARLFADGREVGKLTSVTLPADRDHAIGLAYVKRTAGEDPLSLSLDSADAPRSAHSVPLPFPG